VKILVADDDPVTLAMVVSNLELFGHEVVEAADGTAAWELLQAPDGPKLAILDWMMPGMSGIDVCQRVRSVQTKEPPYLIILTSRDGQKDTLVALNAGADEFLSKPVDPLELRARIDVGRRMITLRNALAEHARKLEEALARVKTLEGFLPICSYCKRIRDDQQYWQRIENYLTTHTNAVFSHSICPRCWEAHVRPRIEAIETEDD
jgi:sigma-B regulation protein RsbU (phosphoserine phosphatase)